MAAALLAFYWIIVAVPQLRAFFELTPLHALDYVLIGVGEPRGRCTCASRGRRG
jgi:hypothetical protein